MTALILNLSPTIELTDEILLIPNFTTTYQFLTPNS